MRYKEGLGLVGRLQEEMAKTLNEEQKKIFEKYLTAANELSIVINNETFRGADNRTVNYSAKGNYYLISKKR